MFCRKKVFVVIVGFLFSKCWGLGREPEGIIDDIRQFLEDVHVPSIRFDFEEQHFASFECALNEVHVFGLDMFDLLNLTFSWDRRKFGIENMTLAVSPVFISGKYNLDGKIVFPIGNDVVHVFGNGNMSMKLEEVCGSFQLYLKTQAGQMKVRNLDVTFDIKNTDVKLCNLMGGGELEVIFNELFNVLGPTILNYYRPTLTEAFKEKLTDFINELLRKNRNIQLD